MNIDYRPHFGIRLPPAGTPLDTWVATTDLQTYEGQRYYAAGAVRWRSSDLHVASVTLPVKFTQSRNKASAAAYQLVDFLNQLA